MNVKYCANGCRSPLRTVGKRRYILHMPQSDAQRKGGTAACRARRKRYGRQNTSVVWRILRNTWPLKGPAGRFSRRWSDSGNFLPWGSSSEPTLMPIPVLTGRFT